MTRNLKNTPNNEKPKVGIPLDFRVEIMPSGRGYCVLISGVRAVKSFSFECVTVRSKRRVIKILGEGLEIASLEENVVQISGGIREIEMAYDKF